MWVARFDELAGSFEIASAPRDGFVPVRELALFHSEIAASTELQELELGVDLVLELEVEEMEEQCQWLGCGDRFRYAGGPGRKPIYCERHRNAKKASPRTDVSALRPPPVPDPKPHPLAVQRGAKPEPSRTVAPRNTSSPYAEVLADLEQKRDQLDVAIEALRALAGAA